MSAPLTLRVGIVGASVERGWARVSHVPAVQGLQGLMLGAVVSTDRAKAEAAARAFGAAHGYGDAAELFADPSIGIVTIAVKVPDHRALVLAAAAAGKHVYCEWPLGRDLAEAEALAAAVKQAGIHAAIGLQTRANPAARHVRALLASGAIGRVLSARILSTTMAFGPDVDAGMAFAEDAANGATLATIQAAHTIDFAVDMLGAFAEAGALTTTQFPRVRVGAEATRRARITPDHVLVQGRLASGAPVSIEVIGGRPADATPFRLEVRGEHGSLALVGGAPRGFQSGRLRLLVDGAWRDVGEGELVGLPDEAVNVGGVYAALRDDIDHGTFRVPGFDHAVRLTRMVEDLLASAADGRRRAARGWVGER